MYYLSLMAALENITRAQHLACIQSFTVKREQKLNRNSHVKRHFWVYETSCWKKLSRREWAQGLGTGEDRQGSEHGVHILSPDSYYSDPCCMCTSSNPGPPASQNPDPSSPQTQTPPGASRSCVQLPAHYEDFANVKERQQTDLPKANCLLNFLNECECVCVGNFKRFVRTSQLDQRNIRLVFRHKELFRKWLTF